MHMVFIFVTTAQVQLTAVMHMLKHRVPALPRLLLRAPLHQHTGQNNSEAGQESKLQFAGTWLCSCTGSGVNGAQRAPREGLNT